MDASNEKKTEPEQPTPVSEPDPDADANEQEAKGACFDDLIVEDDVPDTQAQDEEPPGEDVAGLHAQIADLKDKLLRAVAEAENVRRRAEKERSDAAKFGISSFARDLMAVADNFRRALDSVTPEAKESGGEALANLAAGIEMTERELMTAFERNGVTQVEPQQGDRFDPNYHQAIAEVPVTDQPSGTVVHISQIGYLLDDRLLRPAMVTVAKNSGGEPGGDEGGAGDPGDPGATVNTTI